MFSQNPNVGARTCVFLLLSLSKKHKGRFHHKQPAIGDDDVPQVEPQRAENHDEPTVMLPEDDEQPLEGHEQLMKNAENRVVNNR